MLHPTQDHKKKKKRVGNGCAFSVLRGTKRLLKSSVQITNRSNSILKDIYMTLINMNQSCIEIVEGTIELRVFKFLY